MKHNFFTKTDFWLEMHFHLEGGEVKNMKYLIKNYYQKLLLLNIHYFYYYHYYYHCITVIIIIITIIIVIIIIVIKHLICIYSTLISEVDLGLLQLP